MRSETPKFIGTDNALLHRIESDCDASESSAEASSGKGCTLYRYPSSLSGPQIFFDFEDVYSARAETLIKEAQCAESSDYVAMPVKTDPERREDMIVHPGGHFCPLTAKFESQSERYADMDYRHVAVFARHLINGVKYKIKIGGEHGFETSITARPVFSEKHNDWITYIIGGEKKVSAGIWTIIDGLQIPPTDDYWERHACDAYQRYLDGTCGCQAYVCSACGGLGDECSDYPKCECDYDPHPPHVYVPRKKGMHHAFGHCEKCYCRSDAGHWRLKFPDSETAGNLTDAWAKALTLQIACAPANAHRRTHAGIEPIAYSHSRNPRDAFINHE